MTNPPTDAERWQMMFQAAHSLIQAPLVAACLIGIFALLTVMWRRGL